MKMVKNVIKPATFCAITLAVSLTLNKPCWSATTPAQGATDVAPLDGNNQPTPRTAEELIAEITSDQRSVASLLGPGNAVLKNSVNRTAMAPKLIPVLKQMKADLDELATVAPKYKPKIAGSMQQVLAMLSALDDKETTDHLQSMIASKDPGEAAKGQSDQLLARWYMAEKSVAAQTPLIDELEKLDKLHPQSIPLTLLTFELSRDAASPDLSSRMLTITTDTMNNPAASAIKQQVATMKAAAEKVAQAENKPLILAGSMPDGKPFSSAGLKGKVILVDFWATWCGPCKAELPRVQKIYSDYHAKGLEVVGVSNDFDVDALKHFVADNQMPWPELFDADAAENHQWNSITLGQGIQGIPTMFLIDKKGIVRTVNARDNMEEMIPKLLAEAD